MEMIVTKRVTFDASHYLDVPAWSKEKNKEIFHKCSKYKEGGKEEPHGHTYIVEVSVAGKVDFDTGFVIDFKILSSLIKEKVVEVLDHRLINNVPFFKDKNVTAENIAKFIWDQLVWEINSPQRRLFKVKVWETPDSYATYDGNLDPDEYAK